MGFVLVVSIFIFEAGGCLHRGRVLRRVVSLEDIAALLEGNESKLEDFEGRARIFLSVEGVKQRAWASILFKSPSALKIEVNGFLGMNVMTALVRGDRLEVYIPSMNKVIEGKADGDVIRQIVGIDLGPHDPKYAFLGMVRLGQEDLERVIGFEDRGGERLATLKEGDLIRRVWIDEGRLVAVEEELYDWRGNLILRRVMEGHKRIGGVVLPKRIEISQGGSEARLEFAHRVVNGGVSGDEFQMRLPEGVLRISLRHPGCDANGDSHVLPDISQVLSKAEKN